MFNVLVAAMVSAALGPGAADGARAILDTALARMGGLTALSAIRTARVEAMTEWQRTTFDGRPNPMVSSYEWSTEWRDYARPAWRYTRRFAGATGWTEIVDVVTDSIAAIRTPNGVWSAQNGAYVDERREVFTFSPERILVLAAASPDLALLTDTVVKRAPHARLRCTINGVKATILVRRADGLLAAVQFTLAQPLDFGLASFGAMRVELWYSRWTKLADQPVSIPTQLDIFRAGAPYKRVVILGLRANPVIPADSFAIDTGVTRAFLANRGKAMYDVALDSAAIIEGTFASFGVGGADGAVKIGGRWLLLEPGVAPRVTARSLEALHRLDATAVVAGAFVGAPFAQGGIVYLVDQRIDTWVAGGAVPFVPVVLSGWAKQDQASRVLTSPRRIRIGTDSARVELVDLPDYPGTAILYVPSLRWVYVPRGPNRYGTTWVAALARERGWVVDRISTPQSVRGDPVAAP